MRLRHYLVLITLPALALAVISLRALASIFLLPEFERQDALSAEQNAELAASAIAQDISSMDGIVKDWAWWDETYQAAESPNEAFAQANLIDSAFTNLQISLFVLVNTSGEVVQARGFDLQNRQRVDVPQSLLAQINSANPLLSDLGVDAQSGLLLLPEGTLKIAAASILPSNLEGPSAGTLLIGRWLDQDRLVYLSNVIGLPIELLEVPTPADLSALGWQPEQEDGDFWSKALNEQWIDGFAAVQDIYGQTAVVLRVRSPRQVYQNSLISLHFFAVWLAILLSVFTLIGLWLADRFISRRITELSQRIGNISQANEKLDPLPVQGRDEISEMALAFNAMLERIKRSEADLLESEQRMRMIVENLPVMAEALDEHERIIFWNKECEQVTGYSSEEILAHPHPLALLHPDPVYLDEMLRRSYADPSHRNMIWELTCKDGTVKTIAYSNISRQCPIPGWHEWAIGMDISEQTAALEALRKREHDFTTLVENSPDLIVRYDTQLRHIYGNKAAEIAGVPLALLLGKKPSEQPIPPEIAAHIEETLSKALESGQTQVVEQFFPALAGGAYFETQIVPERGSDGEIESLLTISREVSQRVRAEQTLQRKAQIEASLGEVSKIFLTSDQSFEHAAAIFLSEAQKLTHSEHGFVSAFNPEDGEDESFSFSTLMRKVNREDPSQIQIKLVRHPNTQDGGLSKGLFTSEKPFYRNDFPAAPAFEGMPQDHSPIVNLLSYPIIVAGETLGQIALSNKPGGYCDEDLWIVERLAQRYGLFLMRMRMLEALSLSEERYRTFINSTTDLVLLKDSGLRHLMVNTKSQEFFGKSEAEIVGKTDFDLMPEAQATACRESDLKTIENLDYTVTREEVGDQIYETRKFPVRLGKGEVGVGAFIRDVTEMAQAEQVIKAALEERTVLLREVQHRSKNNLQAMIALMQMRDETIKDPDMHLLLLQLEEQARTMALVYEQLYQSKSLSEVSMQSYLKQLVNNLVLVFETGFVIQLEIQAQNAAGEPLALPANRAMPCGLIVNELVTNALKYAFPPDFAGQPKIRVAMNEEADGQFRLLIGDNGIGLPPDFDPHTRKSLGMRLVRLWATHQMGGEFKIQSPPGVQYTITFRNSE